MWIFRKRHYNSYIDHDKKHECVTIICFIDTPKNNREIAKNQVPSSPFALTKAFYSGLGKSSEIR